MDQIDQSESPRLCETHNFSSDKLYTISTDGVVVCNMCNTVLHHNYNDAIKEVFINNTSEIMKGKRIKLKLIQSILE